MKFSAASMQHCQINHIKSKTDADTTVMARNSVAITKNCHFNQIKKFKFLI